jgi:NTE family protein
MAPVPPSPANGAGAGPVAFVLSGGGNLGALQIGMLRALLEHNVRPDLIVGCSVGAINGAGFADAPTLERLADLERLWLGLDRRNLLPSGWSNAVALARRGEAVHDHSGLRGMAKEALRAATFEDLAVHFECVATDMAGVQEVWFNSGPLIEPILASSALPAIYPAVEIDDVRYLDGGIVNDVPMSRAVELGAATIYILQVGSFMRPRPEPRRPLDVAVQAYWVARHHRFKRELESLPPDVVVHVLPTGETPRMRFNDFTQSDMLIARAHEAATAYLDELVTGRQPVAPLDRLPAAGHNGNGHGRNGNGADAENAGVRRWARATMLRRRIADLPLRRTPAPSGSAPPAD